MLNTLHQQNGFSLHHSRPGVGKPGPEVPVPFLVFTPSRVSWMIKILRLNILDGEMLSASSTFSPTFIKPVN